MAPPRKHNTDVILDAARGLVLRDGPRAASIAAIATASGAPVGTLYHRFGSRNELLAAAWFRALERFQSIAMAASSDPDPVQAALGMARAVLTFARPAPDDALLLLMSPRDLFGGEPSPAFNEQRAAMNVTPLARIATLTLALYGGNGDREQEAFQRAVIDLPYSALYRHARDIPEWLEPDLLREVETLLTGHPECGDPARDK